MSQYFEMGDETLWNPANIAARMFLRQITLFEDELGLPSGIVADARDDAEVDPQRLEPFVGALLAWRANTGHTIVHALADGFVATMLVLAERAGVTPQWPVPRAAANLDGTRGAQVGAGTVSPETWADDLRDEARRLSRYMAR